MEESALDETLGLAEGKLRASPGELVNENAAIVSFGDDRGEVVALGVPRHLFHLLEMRQNQTESLGPLSFVGLVPR